MRLGLFVTCILIPAIAWAKPTVAVAPLEGDKNGKVAEVVTEIADEDNKVIAPAEVGGAMEKLDLSGEMDRKAAKKLRVKLEADFVVQGKVEKNDGEKTLELVVSGKGKKRKKLQVKFKSEKSSSFKKELRTELASALQIVGEDTEPDEDEPKPPPDEKPVRDDKADEDQTREDEAKRVAKRDAEERERRRKRRDENNDDDGDSDGDGNDDDDGPRVKRRRHPVTQVAVRVTAGPTLGRRTLTYDSSAEMPPRRVGTLAGGGRIEAEVYPFAINTLKGAAAGVGFAGEFEKTLGLKIRVPSTGGKETPINQQAFSLGVRYRFVRGASAYAIGIDYARRQYIADRTILVTGSDLDMPDVDYSAFAPVVSGRFGINRSTAVYVDAKAMLMMSTGQIQRADSYGPADVISFEAALGLDYALAKSYGIRFGIDFWQAGFSFNAPQGSMAATRSVSGVTDRVVSVGLALAVTY